MNGFRISETLSAPRGEETPDGLSRQAAISGSWCNGAPSPNIAGNKVALCSAFEEIDSTEQHASCSSNAKEGMPRKRAVIGELVHDDVYPLVVLVYLYSKGRKGEYFFLAVLFVETA